MTARSTVQTRPKLDRDRVVDTALGLADTEGLDAVTIRRLAQELSVTPMALYWHFKDKDALIASLADRLWSEVLVANDRVPTETDRAEAGWARLRAVVVALIEVMRRHPAVAGQVPHRALECEAGLEMTERTLELLESYGFDLETAVAVCQYVLCTAVMLVGFGPGNEFAGQADVDEMLRHKRIALASLPLGRYPRVAAAAADFVDCGNDFSTAVDLIVAGVRSQAPGTPAKRRRQASSTTTGV